MQDKIIRLTDVISKTGLSRASIYLKMKDGTFPQSRCLSYRAVGWLESDILEWIESLPTSKTQIGGK